MFMSISMILSYIQNQKTQYVSMQYFKCLLTHDQLVIVFNRISFPVLDYAFQFFLNSSKYLDTELLRIWKCSLLSDILDVSDKQEINVRISWLSIFSMKLVMIVIMFCTVLFLKYLPVAISSFYFMYAQQHVDEWLFLFCLLCEAQRPVVKVDQFQKVV